MRISEIFYSLQGEGIHQGLPMVFVRTQGCNLAEGYGGCRWCDTAYAQESIGGEELSIEAVVREVSKYRCPKVCITGGEPLWQPELGELMRTLGERGYWLEVETSGSLSVADHLARADCWVVDVKCPASGMAAHNCLDNLSLLREVDQVKFVVHDDTDVDFAQSIVRDYPTDATILLSPVYGDASWLVRVAEHVKGIPQARLSFQLHKSLWGGRGA
jgi:7-carboxy-7-deazaguanine synthase